MTTQPSHTERVESVSDVFAEKLGCQLHQVLGALDALIASEKRARIKSHNQRKELRLLSTAYRNMWDVVGERIDRERERANNADQRATKAERELDELRGRVDEATAAYEEPDCQYYNGDEPCSLDRLCRAEPEWAASRIRVMRRQLHHLRSALAATETEAQAGPGPEEFWRQGHIGLTAERDALRAELEQARADLTQAECARDDLQKKRDRLANDMREKNGYIARLERELRDTKSERDQYKSAYDNEIEGNRTLSMSLLSRTGLRQRTDETFRDYVQRCGDLVESLTIERDAARTALARLRAKVGPVVEWWREYRDIAGIAPVLGVHLENLIAGWED